MHLPSHTITDRLSLTTLHKKFLSPSLSDTFTCLNICDSISALRFDILAFIYLLSIKKLNISENEITDKGFKPFGTLFYKNSSINHFDVSCNFLTNSGIVNFWG